MIVKCANLNFTAKMVFKMIKYRFIHSTTVAQARIQISARLLPEVEKGLEAEEFKHRKHPGVRKHKVLTLPEKLIDAAEKVLSTYSLRDIVEEAKSLNNRLHSRLLPMEKMEMQRKTGQAMEKLEISNEDWASADKASMKKLNKLKKTLVCEMGNWQPIEYTYHTGILYMVARLAANYSSIYSVLTEISTLLPSFQPKTFFDFGSGIGSALWAANEFWGNSIKEYFCIDSSAEISMLCQRLLQGGASEGPMMLKDVYFRQFLPASSERKYDLVVCAFSLMELSSSQERLRIIDILWQKTADTLIVIESGTIAGFTAVLEARDYIMKVEEVYGDAESNGAHVLVPCPHSLSCPRLGSRHPCSFPVKYHPFYPPKVADSVRQSLFSYAVLRRGERDSSIRNWPRIIEPVVSRSKLALCRLCCADGKVHEMIFTKGKNEKNLYQCAKRSSHGDCLPITLGEPISNTTIESIKENLSEDIN